jgi:hypothetical protein
MPENIPRDVVRVTTPTFTSTTAAAIACLTGVPIHVQRLELQGPHDPHEWVDFPGATYVEHDGEAEVLPPHHEAPPSSPHSAGWGLARDRVNRRGKELSCRIARACAGGASWARPAPRVRRAGPSEDEAAGGWPCDRGWSRRLGGCTQPDKPEVIVVAVPMFKPIAAVREAATQRLHSRWVGRQHRKASNGAGDQQTVSSSQPRALMGSSRKAGGDRVERRGPRTSRWEPSR